MADTNEKKEKISLEEKKPKKIWPWILGISLIVIVGFAIWGIVELVQHNKKNKYIINYIDKKESSVMKFVFFYNQFHFLEKKQILFLQEMSQKTNSEKIMYILKQKLCMEQSILIAI